jgi:glycosyltransferase involved in cell wall biosynthesis
VIAEPRLSVTVTNYNYGRFLGPCIESVLNQTFGDFELILIDNASDDDSVEVMRHYEGTDERIIVIAHERNQGMHASLCEGVDRSRGRYRVQIDADDWVLTPDAFATQVRLLDDHPEVAFVYASLTQIDSDGKVFFVSRPYPGDVIVPGEVAVEQILHFNLNDTGTMIRLDAYRRTAGYPERSPHISDTQMASRLCAVGDVAYIDRPLYAFHQHGTNLHFRHQAPVMRDEILPMIDEVFDGPLRERMADPEATKRRIVRNALVHLPTMYIFSGAALAGWRMYWESVKIKPLDTVLQRRTLALLARTVVGGRAYGWLRQRMAPDQPAFAGSSLDATPQGAQR